MTDRLRTLKVAYVVEGPSTFIASEILELRRQGADVVVLSAFRPDPSAESPWGDSLYFPPRYRGVAGSILASAAASPILFARLALLLIRQSESLRLLALGSYFARVVRRLGLRHLHGTYGTRTTTLAHVVARLAGVEYSFTTHSYDFIVRNPSLVWKSRGARFVRTISEFSKRTMLEMYPGLDPAKIHVRYLGVDTEMFAPSADPAEEGGPIRILSAGSFIPEKGHIHLIRACALLEERGVPVSCTIVGSGPLREEATREVTSRGLQDSIHLPGELPNDALPARLGQAAVFVLACVDARPMGATVDGLPVALMEAMAAGRPVVSTKVAGIPELIEDGVSGLLVAPGDEHALADAIERLARDPAARAALGRAARDRVVKHFQLARNTRALADLFEARPALAGDGDGG